MFTILRIILYKTLFPNFSSTLLHVAHEFNCNLPGFFITVDFKYFPHYLLWWPWRSCRFGRGKRTWSTRGGGAAFPRSQMETTCVKPGCSTGLPLVTPCPTGTASEQVHRAPPNKSMIAQNSDPARRGVWTTPPGSIENCMAKGKRDLELMVERGGVSISCGPKADCRHKDCNVSCSLLLWNFVIRKSGPSKLCRTNVWMWRICVHHQWRTVVVMEVPCTSPFKRTRCEESRGGLSANTAPVCLPHRSGWGLHFLGLPQASTEPDGGPLAELFPPQAEFLWMEDLWPRAPQNSPVETSLVFHTR